MAQHHPARLGMFQSDRGRVSQDARHASERRTSDATVLGSAEVGVGAGWRRMRGRRRPPPCGCLVEPCGPSGDPPGGAGCSSQSYNAVLLSSVPHTTNTDPAMSRRTDISDKDTQAVTSRSTLMMTRRYRSTWRRLALSRLSTVRSSRRSVTTTVQNGPHAAPGTLAGNGLSEVSH